jgi:multiple sugar transport system permease protein
MRALSRIEKREAIAGYLFILPWIIGFIVFTAGPIITAVVLSLMKWSVISAPKFVGFRNYVTISKDPYFWQSLKVTAIYMVTVPLHIVLGLAIALLLNTKIRALSLFRTIYYLPCVISGVAVALLWVWIFNPRFGLFNVFLSYLGIQGPEWLASEIWVLPAFIIMSFWGVGSFMLIYLAGLQSVPNSLYDAATVDGANRWQKFKHVTLPSISPVLLFNIIMGMIGTSQIFTPAYVMTEGGPNNASLFYVLYLYRNAFEWFKMGYASALAWILFWIVLAGMIVMFRFSKSRIYYAGVR